MLGRLRRQIQGVEKVVMFKRGVPGVFATGGDCSLAGIDVSLAGGKIKIRKF